MRCHHDEVALCSQDIAAEAMKRTILSQISDADIAKVQALYVNLKVTPGCAVQSWPNARVQDLQPL